jgi:hypothetical protein
MNTEHFYTNVGDTVDGTHAGITTVDGIYGVGGGGGVYTVDGTYYAQWLTNAGEMDVGNELGTHVGTFGYTTYDDGTVTDDGNHDGHVGVHVGSGVIYSIPVGTCVDGTTSIQCETTVDGIVDGITVGIHVAVTVDGIYHVNVGVHVYNGVIYAGGNTSVGIYAAQC